MVRLPGHIPSALCSGKLPILTRLRRRNTHGPTSHSGPHNAAGPQIPCPQVIPDVRPERPPTWMCTEITRGAAQLPTRAQF